MGVEKGEEEVGLVCLCFSIFSLFSVLSFPPFFCLFLFLWRSQRGCFLPIANPLCMRLLAPNECLSVEI